MVGGCLWWGKEMCEVLWLEMVGEAVKCGGRCLGGLELVG